MFSFSVKHLSDTVGTGFTASRAVGSAEIAGTGMKPVLRKYGIRTSYTVDEANGSEPYEVDTVFPSGTYSALDYTPVWSGHRFAGWSDGSELPYDSEVEYLDRGQGDSAVGAGPYIDTGMVFPSNYYYYIDCYLYSPVSGGQSAYHGAGQLSVFHANGQSYCTGLLSDDRITTPGRYVLDRAKINRNTTSRTFVFFNMRFGDTGALARGSGSRLYRFTVWNTSMVLLADFIPVRVGQEGCLYESVSRQLFRNNGTGSLLYGDDVPARTAIPVTNMSHSDSIRHDLSTVTAVWQFPVAVAFDATSNGGEMPSGWTSPHYYGGKDYGTLPTPTKADNVFLGWFTPGGTRITTSSECMYIPHTLIAHYTVPTYDTSFEVTTTSSYRKAGIYAANSRNTANPTIVDWGDGSTSVVYGNISQLVHTYSSNGTFTVQVNNNILSFALSANNSTWYQTTTDNRYVVKKVTAISPNVNSVPNQAFCYCSAMTDFSFWSGYKAIPQYCFAYCHALTGVAIPSDFTAINNYAFYYCNNSAFTSITIPASVTAIGVYAFGYCSYLHDITFEPSSATLTLYTYAFMRCFYSTGVSGTIDLSPRKITSIPNNCFYYCRYLNGIVWPQGLTSIGQYSFCNCFDMAAATGTLSIPEGVTALSGNYSFGYCRYLTAVTLPSTLTRIGSYCFYNCVRLASITCNRSAAPTVSAGTFGNGTGNYTGRNSYSAGTNRLYVPAGATGYGTGYWLDPLQSSTKCGFTLEEMQ